MRRALVPLSFILLLFPCSAETFLSNALGQDLGAAAALTGTGYEGERDGGRTVIYLDGEVIRTRTDTETGYTLQAGDIVETVTLDDQGRRAEWRLSTPEREEIHRYFYDGERLSSMSVSVDGTLIRRVIYLDTPFGTLSGISGSGDAYIAPSFYQYDLDGDAIRFTYHDSGIVTRENLSAGSIAYEVEDDGSWTETETLPDGSESVRVYSPEGRLSEERRGSNVTVYSYDDVGNLTESVTSDGTSETSVRYEGGRMVSSEEKEGGETVKLRNYLDSGEIEEIRYRGGVPEYSILFEGDGVRVKEIHRL